MTDPRKKLQLGVLVSGSGTNLQAILDAAGQDRIYIPGEKEYEQLALRSAEGIPLDPQVVEDLCAISGETGVAFDVAVEAGRDG